MNRPIRLTPVIQDYQWGHESWLQDFLHAAPEAYGHRWAELWVGTHPKGMSMLSLDGRQMSLEDYIERDPVGILGPRGSAVRDGRLPLLLKILAIDEPLSIQCHPDLLQAATGYEREDRLGIPLDSPQRSYKDRNHKPELYCALTDSVAMCGFRPIEQIKRLFCDYFPRMGGYLLQELSAAESPHKRLLELILSQDERLLEVYQSELQSFEVEGLEADLIRRFSALYPRDLSTLAPLYLNVFTLKPFEAIYQPAGELHAYVQGIGVEVMANSDNVLRGGMTVKHVDAEGLGQIVRFEAATKGKSDAVMDTFGRSLYLTEADEFTLACCLQGSYSVDLDGAFELLLQTEGSSTIFFSEGGEPEEQRIEASEVYLIPASVKRYELKTDGVLFCASVPGSHA